MKSAYYEVLRNLIFRSIQKETRLSERQVAQLRWEQINGAQIITQYGRRVEMSKELVDALALLPRQESNRYVFFGSPLLHLNETEEMREIRESLWRNHKPTSRKFVIFQRTEA